jgi:hypothetical protein
MTFGEFKVEEHVLLKVKAQENLIKIGQLYQASSHILFSI